MASARYELGAQVDELRLRGDDGRAYGLRDSSGRPLVVASAKSAAR